MFLESGTAGVRTRSVNEKEPGPISCLTCRITGVLVEGTAGRRGGEARKWGGRGNYRERMRRVRRKEQGRKSKRGGLVNRKNE